MNLDAHDLEPLFPESCFSGMKRARFEFKESSYYSASISTSVVFAALPMAENSIRSVDVAALIGLQLTNAPNSLEYKPPGSSPTGHPRKSGHCCQIAICL